MPHSGIRISFLASLGFLLFSGEILATEETCDEHFYYCESLGSCLFEFGSTACDGECGTWDWFIYCPSEAQCFDPEEKWLCNGECRDAPPMTGTHTPCNGTCGHPWFHLCEGGDVCANLGVPCEGVCWEENTVLCDERYCNHVDDVDDSKFDCYDRSDETLTTEWEISQEKNNKFLQLEEAVDTEFNP